MNHQKMMDRASREVVTRALKIKSCAEQGHLDCEYYGALGYISSARDLGIFNASQYVTALGAFDAALTESVFERTKKAAPSAANTESDKEKRLNFSLEQKDGAVKPKAIAHIRMELFPNDGLRADINGEGINLSALLASAVMAFRKSGMPEELIRAALDVSMEMAGDSDD